MHLLPWASSLHLLSQAIGNNPINPFFLCVSGSLDKFGYSQTNEENAGEIQAAIPGLLTKIFVKVGDHVKKGEVVGTVGSSGRATGPHLDIRLNWFSERLDPQSILVN